jgi:arylsulfatase
MAQMNRREFLNYAAVGTVTLILPRQLLGRNAAVARLNFIIILTDDQGYNDLGCFGSKLINTPRIDQMAEQGIKFTSFYVQPICGPSRTALMTGCYPIRVAELENKKHVHPVVHPDEILLSELLKSAGYATACVGKWDLGGHARDLVRADLNPIHCGFDFWYGLPSSNDNGAFNLYRNDKIIAGRTDLATLTRRYTDQSIEFIKQNKDRPFFLYLAHTMPHVKLDASDPFKGKSAFGLYGDVIEEIDFNTGRILDTLIELGLEKDTIVVYTSDNGPWRARTTHAGSAYPLRSGKITTWEGGMRVPCVMWAPGIIPPGSICNELATSMDLLPTLAKIAHVPLPNDRIIDGKDIFPLMTAKPEAKTPHKAFYYYLYTHLQAVRSGPWKLVLPRPRAPEWIGSLAKKSHWRILDVEPVEKPQLYNLQTDIGERRDVADQYPEIVDRLLTLAQQARQDLGDYDRIGNRARFFDKGPRRIDEKKWLKNFKGDV